MYHGVGPYTGHRHTELHVSSTRFEAQLGWLTDHGYTGITPSQCTAWLLRGEALPVRSVLLTFDDAYANLMTYAFPPLASHGFSAGVYACTRLLGTRTPWDEQPLMTADDIVAWSKCGIEFGAHSRTHPYLTSLDVRGLREETEGSVRDLESLLGRSVQSFAYPYGDHDARVASAVGKACAIAFTVREGLASRRADPLRIPRTMVHPQDGSLDMYMHTLLGRNPMFHVRRVPRLLHRLRR